MRRIFLFVLGLVAVAVGLSIFSTQAASQSEQADGSRGSCRNPPVSVDHDGNVRFSTAHEPTDDMRSIFVELVSARQVIVVRPFSADPLDSGTERTLSRYANTVMELVGARSSWTEPFTLYFPNMVSTRKSVVIPVPGMTRAEFIRTVVRSDRFCE